MSSSRRVLPNFPFMAVVSWQLEHRGFPEPLCPSGPPSRPPGPAFTQPANRSVTVDNPPSCPWREEGEVEGVLDHGTSGGLKQASRNNKGRLARDRHTCCRWPFSRYSTKSGLEAHGRLIDPKTPFCPSELTAYAQEAGQEVFMHRRRKFADGRINRRGCSRLHGEKKKDVLPTSADETLSSLLGRSPSLPPLDGAYLQTSHRSHDAVPGPANDGINPHPELEQASF